MCAIILELFSPWLRLLAWAEANNSYLITCHGWNSRLKIPANSSGGCEFLSFFFRVVGLFFTFFWEHEITIMTDWLTDWVTCGKATARQNDSPVRTIDETSEGKPMRCYEKAFWSGVISLPLSLSLSLLRHAFSWIWVTPFNFTHRKVLRFDHRDYWELSEAFPLIKSLTPFRPLVRKTESDLEKEREGRSIRFGAFSHTFLGGRVGFIGVLIRTAWLEGLFGGFCVFG